MPSHEALASAIEDINRLTAERDELTTRMAELAAKLNRVLEVLGPGDDVEKVVQDFSKRLVAAEADYPGEGLPDQFWSTNQDNPMAILMEIGSAGVDFGMNGFGWEKGRLISFVDGIGDMEPTKAQAEALTLAPPALWRANRRIKSLMAAMGKIANKQHIEGCPHEGDLGYNWPKCRCARDIAQGVDKDR